MPRDINWAMTRVGNKRGRPVETQLRAGRKRPASDEEPLSTPKKRMKKTVAVVETPEDARAGRKRPASDEEPLPTPKKRMKKTVAVVETPEDAPSADSITPTPESITPTVAVVETVETPAEPSKVDYVMLTMEIIKLLTYMQTFNFPIYDIFPEDKFKYLDEKYSAYREYSRLNNYNNNLLQFMRNRRDPEEGGVNDEERKRFAEYVCEESLKALNAEKQPKDSGRRHCAGCGDCLH